jgi:hypothetical protein
MHILCSGCLTDFFNSEITEPSDAIYLYYADNRLIKCMCDQKCTGFFTIESIQKLLNEYEMPIFEKFIISLNQACSHEISNNTTVLDTKEKVINSMNNILTTSVSCPYCRAPFYDFSGCLALTCANPRCKKNFCGLCMQKHKYATDPHMMVLVCGKKLSTVQITEYEIHSYFMSSSKWELWKERQKLKEMIKWLVNLGYSKILLFKNDIIIYLKKMGLLNAKTIFNLEKIIDNEKIYENMSYDIFSYIMTICDMVPLLDFDIVLDKNAREIIMKISAKKVIAIHEMQQSTGISIPQENELLVKELGFTIDMFITKKNISIWTGNKINPLRSKILNENIEFIARAKENGKNINGVIAKKIHESKLDDRRKKKYDAYKKEREIIDLNIYISTCSLLEIYKSHFQIFKVTPKKNITSINELKIQLDNILNEFIKIRMNLNHNDENEALYDVRDINNYFNNEEKWNFFENLHIDRNKKKFHCSAYIAVRNDMGFYNYGNKYACIVIENNESRYEQYDIFVVYK